MKITVLQCERLKKILEFQSYSFRNLDQRTGYELYGCNICFMVIDGRPKEWLNESCPEQFWYSQKQPEHVQKGHYYWRWVIGLWLWL